MSTRSKRKSSHTASQRAPMSHQEAVLRIVMRRLARLSDRSPLFPPHCKPIHLDWGQLALDLTKVAAIMMKLTESTVTKPDAEVAEIILDALEIYTSAIPSLLDEILWNAVRAPLTDAEFPGTLAFHVLVPEILHGDLPGILRDPFLSRGLADLIERRDWSAISWLVGRLKEVLPRRPRGKKPLIDPSTGRPLRDELLRQKKAEGAKASYLAAEYGERLNRTIRDEAVAAAWSRARKGPVSDDPARRSLERLLEALDYERSRKRES